MPIAFDNGVYGGSVFAVSQTTAFVMSALKGGCVLLGALGEHTDSITGAAYGGSALALVDKQCVDAAAVWFAYLFLLVNPPTGNNNMVVSTVGGSPHIESFIASYTGVRSAQPNAHGVNGGTGDPYVTSITPTVDGCWAVEFVNASVGVIDSTNFTNRVVDGGNTARIGDSNGIITSGASFSMNVTGAGGQKQSEILTLAPLDHDPRQFVRSQAVQRAAYW